MQLPTFSRTTFSQELADALTAKLDILTQAQPERRNRIMVRPLDQAAAELYAAQFNQPNCATCFQIRAMIADMEAAGLGGDLTPQFLLEEWTERHLLYVACTRARDRLLVTGLEPGSEFLEDLVSRQNVLR